MPTEDQNTMPTAASVMPEANAQGEQTPVPMNVQTGSPDLIDDVSDGANATAEAPMDSRVNNMADAKMAFAQLLAAASQQNAQPEASPAPENPDTTPEIPSQPEPTPDATAPMQQSAFEPMSKDSLREMLQEELQKAIAEGRAPNASREDMAGDMTGNIEPAEPLSNEQPSFNMPDITSDEFYSKISDDPGSAIMEVAEAIAAQKVAELQGRLQPLLDQSEMVQRNQRVQDAIKTFSDRGYDDFGRYRESMVNYLKQGDFNMEDPNAYELAYNRAKASELQSLNQQLSQQLTESQSQGRALVDYMQDPESINQMAQNEDVKKAVINEYLRGLSTGEKPQIISDATSNTPSGIAPQSPKSFREAGEMFKRML